ncbi:MAG TPA: hypothetical protein VGE93_10255 [Bryobacteraceae bacterium]
MNRILIGFISICAASSIACSAQQTLPDAPSVSATAPASSIYSPPTQGERFKAYVKHTYSITSVIEAGVRGGIDQARDKPSEWPEGAQGYADRFGSVMGQIAIRRTTEYLVADLFREDIRFIPCQSPCAESKFNRALEDTFTARRGDDGHRAFSIARLSGPIVGSAVAKNTWYPAGYGGSEIARQAAMSYAFVFVRNLIRELAH